MTTGATPITVCDQCRRASCWGWTFPCENGYSAGTVDVPASVLAKEDREHRSYYDPDGRYQRRLRGRL